MTVASSGSPLTEVVTITDHGHAGMTRASAGALAPIRQNGPPHENHLAKGGITFQPARVIVWRAGLSDGAPFEPGHALRLPEEAGRLSPIDGGTILG